VWAGVDEKGEEKMGENWQAGDSFAIWTAILKNV